MCETFYLTNRMWFSVVCTLINNEYASSQWSKCCGLTRRSRVSPLHYANELLVRVRLSFQILLHAQHAETVRKKCLGKE